MPLSKITGNSFSASANTDIDNGTLFVDVTNNRLGLGTKNPLTTLHIDTGIMTTQRYASVGGAVVMRNAAGDTNSPTPTQQGTTTGILVGRGYDGSAYRDVASVSFIADANTGNVTNTSSPGSVVLSTTPIGALGSIQRVIVTANGVVQLANGQLQFPATQQASADANTLDDYEEGTYTPTITTTVSGSITLNSSINLLKYTKVGNLVTIQGRFNVSSVSSPVGAFRISLPFLPTSGTGKESDYMALNVYTHGVDLDPNAVSLFAEANGVINAGVFQVRDNASWQALNAASITGNGSEYFYIVGTYMAA